MKIVVTLALVMVSVVALTLGIQHTSQAENHNPEAIKQIVRDTIMEEPELIVNAITKYQEEQAAEEEAAQKEKLEGLGAKLRKEEGLPMAGNAKGDVTVVEFFDYNCPYCKTSFEAIDDALEQDNNLYVIMMEMPIFGEESINISSIALAVHQLDASKYYDYHAKLMRTKGRMSAQQALDIAIEMGFDGEAIKQAAESQAVTDALTTVRSYASELKVNGTPAFIVGETFVGGALNLERLQGLIAKAREE